MLEIVGVVLLVQGVGGLLNHWLDGSASWYLVNYIDTLAGLALGGVGAAQVQGS